MRNDIELNLVGLCKEVKCEAQVIGIEGQSPTLESRVRHKCTSVISGTYVTYYLFYYSIHVQSKGSV